jgi:hypothetical protein
MLRKGSDYYRSALASTRNAKVDNSFLLAAATATGDAVYGLVSVVVENTSSTDTYKDTAALIDCGLNEFSLFSLSAESMRQAIVNAGSAAPADLQDVYLILPSDMSTDDLSFSISATTLRVQAELNGEKQNLLTINLEDPNDITVPDPSAAADEDSTTSSALDPDAKTAGIPLLPVILVVIVLAVLFLISYRISRVRAQRQRLLDMRQRRKDERIREEQERALEDEELFRKLGQTDDEHLDQFK